MPPVVGGVAHAATLRTEMTGRTRAIRTATTASRKIASTDPVCQSSPRVNRSLIALPNMYPLGPADEQRRHELPDRRDEHEHERGEHAREAERQRDPRERPPPARAEVARRLEEAPVEVLEGDEDRQRDERHPDVASTSITANWL